jgi:environmental stress-induced protein Ves
MSKPNPHLGLKILPAAGHRRYRWRNDLGEATEIAAESLDPAVPGGWTLSIATVDSDVEFSCFPETDRHLMALSGAGLDLIVNGNQRSLARGDVVSFAGEDSVSSIGVSAPTLDLNLMVHRGRDEGTLVATTVAGTTTFSTPAGTTTFILLLEGEMVVGDRLLGVHDALSIEPGSACTATGSARIAVARIRVLNGSN